MGVDLPPRMQPVPITRVALPRERPCPLAAKGVVAALLMTGGIAAFAYETTPPPRPAGWRDGRRLERFDKVCQVLLVARTQFQWWKCVRVQLPSPRCLIRRVFASPGATSCGLFALLAGHPGLSFQRLSAKGDGLP